MSLLVVLFSVGVLSHHCVLGALDEHDTVASDLPTGAVDSLPIPQPQNEMRQYREDYVWPSFLSLLGRKCPLCDSSVFSYCGEKLFHDACCCSQFPYDLPYKCHLADCNFLHSRNCREHKLIANCCCSDDYRTF